MSACTQRLIHPVPSICFDEALPVCARRQEISDAISAHQVVIVCGETGSGKTTQLPKIALSLGRGLGAGGKGLIGHTQPRRVAASSVAKRIAQELNSPLGEVVGFKVRFQDRFQAGASVKLMTDGILLAETQSDSLLRAYDTIIIDEAHERSLNIDFLLGHLRQVLPKRPDLKLIVTSATIDAERFAEHFSVDGKTAPVIQVSGRLFPVEIRWRPFVENRELDLNQAIGDAIDELWQGPSGDVLVFLPGEREIREAADALRARLSAGVEVLPLFARLSPAEQDWVFEPHGARRVVLATNVAETSLTVPGIRYVVDTGSARMKRYSYRNKVEQLLIEPVSQAAAHQRSGRCGRVSNGICIRLYDEAEFANRPRFTDPEILRSSLAGVILRMKSLGLGQVEDFPFIEPPPRRAITDGYQLLHELGAVDDAQALTAIGKELTKLPLDPRVGRMVLEARTRDALTEVLVIAAAFSAQDVRDRPQEQRDAADKAHRQFDDEKSEFMGDLKLWNWLQNVFESKGEHRLSNKKQEQRLRDHFLSPRRAREWRDLHTQLLTVVREHGWRLNGAPATYEQIHTSILAGLLGNIGCKSEKDEHYQGARGIRFFKHPGANLSKKPERWIVAAELVETTKLFGRSIAAIDPAWLPGLASHLIKTQLLEPSWHKKSAQVIAMERATLYGLMLYHNKPVDYGHVDAAAARTIFIREALLADQWDTRLPFLAANRKLIRQIEELEHKSRRQDVLVDDELIVAFYDRHLPPDVFSGTTLERWYRHASKAEPKLLMLKREDLMRHQADGITSSSFPPTIKLGGVDCKATYLHEPGHARDGLTIHVPIFVLNQVKAERCGWLVPGMLKEKVLTLLKTLPPRVRSRLNPLPESAETFVTTVPFAEGDLLDALLQFVRDKTELVTVQRSDFKPDQLPAHSLANIGVVDEHGRQLAMSRHLASLKSDLGGQARSAFQALAILKIDADVAPNTTQRTEKPPPHQAASVRPQIQQNPRSSPHTSTQNSSSHSEAAPAYTEWSFGELPELMEIRRDTQVLVGFPALIDKTTHVEIEVFDEPERAAQLHNAGLRRLVMLQIKDTLKALPKNIPDLQKLSVAFMPLGTADELHEQITACALDRAFLTEPLPQNAVTFEQRIAQGRGRLALIAQEITRLVGAVLNEFNTATRKLKDTRPSKAVADDIQAQLVQLVWPRFITQTPWANMAHLPRYLKAITLRLDKWRIDPDRDALRMAELSPLQTRWLRLNAERKGVTDAALSEFQWLLQELRVSFFAQELRTPQPVSVKRLERAMAQLNH